jgi:MFS family permease
VSTRPIWLLLRNGGFLRLLSVRLVGSFGDGLLQAALASFVLFSPERQPTPVAIAASFAILLLPYSLLSPFAGVFLDRWRRRQVLVRANWLRAGSSLLIAAVVAAEHVGADLGLVVLVTLGFGRFVLAGLSASLPHVVPRHQLVTANSIAPTAGTIIFGLGLLAGIVLRAILGGGDHGSVMVLVATSFVYVAAGALGLLMTKDQLGPTGDLPGDTVMGVLRGFVDGFASLVGDRPSWRSVSVVLIHRLTFGALTVMLLLILRNALHPVSDPDAALQDFSVIAGAVTLGALSAAFLTPLATRRWGTVNWTSLTLIVAGIAAPFGLIPLNIVAFTIVGTILGMAQQSAKIGADTTLQRRISDDHLGRVFSLFDVGINVSVVVGALLVAFTSPPDGVSIPGFLALGAVYLVAGAWYRLGSRVPRDGAELDPARERG